MEKVMTNFALGYILASTIVNFILFLVWKRNDLLNFCIKFIIGVLTFAGANIIMKQFGYIF